MDGNFRARAFGQRGIPCSGKPKQKTDTHSIGAAIASSEFGKSAETICYGAKK